ncbi:hypothetical protein [Methylobacillus flagellatus]|uniref:hypothetical protein n=1 Tax=Methylobacillus flagellatus TaxID=405 RepID=UPI0010F901DA|nr:hypothetical protein [Methylobacillus flagellatus]
MSRPWFKRLAGPALLRDELQVLVQAHQLLLTRRQAGLRRKLLDQQRIPVPASITSINAADATQGSWTATMRCLASALRDPRWQGCRPTVTLSSQFVHFLVMPWDASLITHSEQQAFLQHCYVQAYGDAARNWDLRTSPGAYGQPSLASAVDHALLNSLLQLFQQADMAAPHIHPLLMQAINDSRKQPATSFSFAMYEQHCITLLLIHKGQWLSVQTHPVRQPLQAHLHTLIQRDAIIAGVQAEIEASIEAGIEADMTSDGWPTIVHIAEPGISSLTLQGKHIHQVPGPYQHGMSLTRAQQT